MVTKLTAIIMAGGKGSRISEFGEKPLVRVGGTELLRRVATALQKSKYVDDIIVACSPHTPSTAREARRLGMRVVVAPGEGFIQDMRYVMSGAQTERVLVVNADLPFLTGELLDKAVERFLRANKPALAVMVPVTTMRKLGFEPPHQFAGLSPAGLNVLDARILGDKEENAAEQEILVVNEVSQLININTPEDVQKAEQLLVRLHITGAGESA